MGEDTDPDQPLRDFVGVLRRRRATIAATVVVAVGLALVAAYLQKPVYAATARVLIEPRQALLPFEPVTVQRPDESRYVAGQIEVLQGEAVEAEVQRRLGEAPPVGVRAVGATSVVQVVAEDGDPRRAAEVANAYAQAYIAQRRQQAVDEAAAAQQELGAKLATFDAQISDLEAQISTAGAASPASLQAQRQTLVEQRAVFKQALDQLQVSYALFTGGAEVVRSATEPSEPARPKPVRNAILAFVLGSVLGVGLAFLVDRLDDSVKADDDIEAMPDGAPVIGRVPVMAGWKSPKKPYVVSVAEPRSAAAEAFRTLRTSIQFVSVERPVRTLQVTSPSTGDGKTTTLANLAVAMAATGLKVVVACGDLRRPRIHEFFGLDNERGLTSVLVGTEPLSRALRAVPGHANLHLLASGPLPPNPSELLSSARATEVLEALQAGADVVLVDSPPVLPVTDALVLSGKVDATVMVCVAGATTRKELARAVEQLRRVDAPLIGTVINGADVAGRDHGYTYASYTEGRRGRSPRASRRSESTLPRRRRARAGAEPGFADRSADRSAENGQVPREQVPQERVAQEQGRSPESLLH